MQKKLFSCCIIFLLSLTLTVSTFAFDSPFADVTSDAAYAESITHLAERGIVFDSDTVDKLIEAAVLTLHHELYGGADNGSENQ